MRIHNVLDSDKVTNRDKAIFLLGYVLGIRACDIVALKLTDINWENDCIQFVQSKTGNTVKLPLCTDIGNALFLYITLEREKVIAIISLLAITHHIIHSLIIQRVIR